jgi:hypothetical protein
MGIDIRFPSSGYFRLSNEADKVIAPQIRHIYIVCRSSRLFAIPNPFNYPREAARKYINIIDHKILISAWKTLLVPFNKLRITLFVPYLPEYCLHFAFHTQKSKR